jgi:hypothetical protein
MRDAYIKLDNRLRRLAPAPNTPPYVRHKAGELPDLLTVSQNSAPIESVTPLLTLTQTLENLLTFLIFINFSSQTFGNFLAMLVTLDRNSLNVDTRRGDMSMPKRILSLDY